MDYFCCVLNDLLPAERTDPCGYSFFHHLMQVVLRLAGALNTQCYMSMSNGKLSPSFSIEIAKRVELVRQGPMAGQVSLTELVLQIDRRNAVMRHINERLETLA